MLSPPASLSCPTPKGALGDVYMPSTSSPPLGRSVASAGGAECDEPLPTVLALPILPGTPEVSPLITTS